MLAKFTEIVNKHRKDATLGIIVFLLMLLAFSMGYITAKYRPTQPIQFIDNQNK